jgi:hypothetical protein
MKKSITILFLFACLLTCSPLAATDVTDAHIAGHVLDAHTQEHLPYVNVQIKGTSMGCLTDESGHFYLKNLPVGTHTVIFSMMGYETIERTIQLQRDTTIELKVAIAETSFVIDNVVSEYDQTMSRAAELIEQKDYNGAIECYKMALYYKTDDVDALKKMSNAYMKLADKYKQDSDFRNAYK